MNRILAFLEGKLAPLGERIGKQRHLKALREGIMMAMPLVLLGSFFVLIKDFPIQVCMAAFSLESGCSFKHNGK